MTQEICYYCNQSIVGIHKCEEFYKKTYGIDDPYRKEYYHDITIFVNGSQYCAVLPLGYVPRSIIYSREEWSEMIRQHADIRDTLQPKTSYRPDNPEPFPKEIVEYIENMKEHPLFKKHFTTEEEYYASLPVVAFNDGGFSVKMYYGKGAYPWNGLRINWSREEYRNVIDVLIQFLDLVVFTDKKDKEYYLSVLFHKESGNLVVYRDGVKILKLEV